MEFRLSPGRIVVAFALLAFCTALSAQRFSFQRYGASQGLTNLVITDLLQDKQGYIWVATFNGLFQYDGTSFERFGETEGIPITGSMFLTETPDGTLWGASGSALFRREGKHFHKFDLPVRLSGPPSVVWTEESPHFLLPTDKGVATLSFRGGNIGTVHFDVSAERGPVYAVYAAPDRSVWYSAASGVCRIYAGRTACFGSREGIPRDHWTAIRMDRNRDLWVRSEKRLRVLRVGGGHFNDGGSGLPPADGTGVLCLDRKGNLFVPTQRGLARMVDGRWKLVTMRQGLASGSTQIAIEDQEGSLWVGHLGAGLERWRGYDSWEGWTDLEGLSNSSILAIKPTTKGDLFLGTDRGLLKFRPGKGTVRSWLETDGLAGEHVFSLLYDRAGNLWAGSTPGGLSRLDKITGRVNRVYPGVGQDGPAISSLAMDADGSIWAGSEHGLLRFRGSPGAGFQLSVPPGTPSEGTSGLLVDRAGRVWAASGGKLHVRVNAEWISIGPRAGLTGEVLFVGEAGDGSIVALNADAQSYRVTDQQGNWNAARLPPLPAPGRLVPYFVGSDSRKAIWVGTDRGVFVLEPGTPGWRWHDEDDGLVWNDTNIGAFQKGEQNDVWIGTSRGLAHYAPTRTGHAPPPLRTLISAVEVNGQTVEPSASLTRRYPVTSLQLRVTALTFLNEGRTRFLYRRRGIDSTWFKTDSRVIMYSDLQPGTYTFDVLAESTDGVVGLEPASITLTVLPPWYLARSFLVIAASGVLLLSIAGYRWRVRAFVRRQRELENAVANRTIELEAERTLERRQHHVLQMIASGSPLNDVFAGITDLVRSRSQSIECSINPGTPPIDDQAPGLTRRFIRSSSSEPVGWIDFDRAEFASGKCDLEKTVAIAIRLASVAIESASAKKKLNYQAHHDSLTGLPNRLHFQESMQRASADANKTGEGFALVYIDLDRFKQINDQCGHRVGDLYLQELSNRFSSCMRKGDLLARLGGDEFAAILPGANSASAAKAIVNALHRSLSNTLFLEAFEFHPCASVGFSLYPCDGTDTESLVRAADEAMYVAKRASKADALEIESVREPGAGRETDLKSTSDSGSLVPSR